MTMIAVALVKLECGHEKFCAVRRVGREAPLLADWLPGRSTSCQECPPWAGDLGRPYRRITEVLLTQQTEGV